MTQHEKLEMLRPLYPIESHPIIHEVLDRLEELEKTEYELRQELGVRHEKIKKYERALELIGSPDHFFRKGIIVSATSMAREALAEKS